MNKLLSRFFALFGAATMLVGCSVDPIEPSKFEVKADWGYLLVTKDDPAWTLDLAQLCWLDASEGYTIYFLDPLLYSCEMPGAKKGSQKYVTVAMTEGSVGSDRRLILPDGTIAHIIPFAPFDGVLGFRYDPINGLYALAAQGANSRGSVARLSQGPRPVFDLDVLGINYLGHLAENRKLTWRDPVEVQKVLAASVPGFAVKRFIAKPPKVLDFECQGTEEIRCVPIRP